MVLRRMALAVTLLAFAVPAAAQFNPGFNHLKCYRIRGKALTKTLMVENQFGRELVAKLSPYLLCTPTKKTCCSNPASVPGCVPVACPRDPTPNQPDAVDHYKCYKIAAKYCVPVAGAAPCSKLSGAMPPTVVTLLDQFTQEQTPVGRPQILCAPVLKRVDSPTTTTTTSSPTTSTTTTLPCRDLSQPGTPPMCGGSCPTGTGLACVYIGGAVGCTCELGCALDTSGVCNQQFCPKAGQQCVSTPTNPCGCCYPPNGPCATAADCCSGVCTASGACQ